jgi:hypothetical protein
MKVGDLFEFPIKYIGFDLNNNSGSRSIDYAAIFQHQKEEFVEKMTRQAVLARYLTSLCWGEESGIPAWQFPIRPPETATVDAGGGPAIEKIVCVDCGRDFLTEEMLQSKNMCFLYNQCCGSGMRIRILGSVPLSNGSGCGSGRPKNIRIRNSGEQS